MFAVDTLDTIADGSTLRSHDNRKYAEKLLHTGTGQDSSDDLSHRTYTDPSMTGRWIGHLDSRNKRLTVAQKHVHKMEHPHEHNRVVGDHRRMMGNDKSSGKTKMKRVDVPSNTQPIGCNGPVICQLGRSMRGVVTQHDPDVPVHAAPHEKLSHGGISKDKTGDEISMIGAGNTVPSDTPNNSNMNNAAGLHYAMKQGPASAYTSMVKQNFMQGMSRGSTQ